ncbi:MAG: hypothetical protein ACREHE_11545 [Rhizomicrobium sp.]
MSDEEPARRPSASSTAASFAMNAAADAVPGEDMRAFVREQTRLAALQSQNLIEQNSFELSHLRWQRFNDQMRGFLQVMAALVGLLVVAAIGAAFWNAAHEDGLVIEAFSVPPDLAARGLTGQAVAAQLQDKLAAMQDVTNSARPAASYSNNWGNDIKVQIPDTGVSVGEFYRYLVGWLGHQTHITGEVFRTASGVSVTARAGGDGGATVTGAETDLDALLQRASEDIYRRTQPYRYAVYVGTDSPHPDRAKATVLFQALLAEPDPKERLWAAIGLGSLVDIGDPGAGAYWMRRAIAIDPGFALPWENLATDDGNFGHDEAVLVDERNAVRLLQTANGEMSERARLIGLASNRAGLEFALCDFLAALHDNQAAANLPDYSGIVEVSRETLIVNNAILHRPGAAAAALRDLPPSSDVTAAVNRAYSKLTADYWLGDWKAVLADGSTVEQGTVKMLATPGVTQTAVDVLLKVSIWPYVAAARAMTGDLKGAHALIDKTPLDCYSCVRSRADIDAAGKNWRGADYWFAMAVRQAPSIPMAYSDWGRVLLLRGDAAGAIAKFKQANDKGPHFADPLQMWGEALMAQNRADLAPAKFTAADKYAPDWGRLHLKWGEALFWSGDKAGAQKQFAVAEGLGLTAGEKQELRVLRARFP